MIKTWKRAGLKAVLAAMLAAAPALAQGTDGPISDSKKLDEIQKQLDEIKKTLADLKTALAAPLSSIQKGIEDMPTKLDLGAEIAKAKQGGDLKEQIGQLRTEIEGLRNRLRENSRVSGFGPTDAAVPPATSRVELLNTYSTDVSIMVNNRVYRLRPGERRLTDAIPAGNFTYEVIGIRPQYTRTVAANDIFTVHVHPQQ